MKSGSRSNRSLALQEPPLSTIAQLLATVDRRPTTASYQQASRQLEELRSELRPVRVALLSTFTVDPIEPYLRVEAARHGFLPDVYIAPFNCIHQELMTGTSGCIEHKPDAVFISMLLRDACPRLASDFLSLTAAEVDAAIEQVVANLAAAVGAFRRLSGSAVVVGNFVSPVHPALGIYEPMVEHSQTNAVRRLNARLAETLRGIAGTYVFDDDALCRDVGHRHWFDAKMWHLARAPLSAAGLLAVGRREATFLRALLAAPRKCLVLDLDNTLWGGILGEVGVEGIKLGSTYPGSAYREFQQTVLQLHRRGILLAINSKNNVADVSQVFSSHPDMLLRPEHFASMHVNWLTKPLNMVEIARELNIGIDSLVFFDDNPAECALMRHALPDVLTIDGPPDPVDLSAALLASAAFERLSFSAEDIRRGEIYREQAQRRTASRGAASLDEFLAELDMTAEIAPVDDFALSRVAELVHKTNQFNLTTRRYSAAELHALAADPDVEAVYLRLRDRYGDNGIVGVAIEKFAGPIATIDSFMLSCRVIGRSAETALLAFLLERARDRGKDTIEGTFIPTAKNAPAADLFARHGFERVRQEGSTTTWRLRVATAPFVWPTFIARASTPVRESR